MTGSDADRGRRSFERLRYTVLAAQREGDRRLTEALARLGLTTAQAEVVRVLDAHGGLTLRELGERLVCEKGSPSRLVKTLAGARVVVSASDPDDGRAVRLRLTARGAELAAQVREIERAFYDALGRVLTAERATALADGLEELLAGSTVHAALERRSLTRAVSPRDAS